VIDDLADELARASKVKACLRAPREPSEDASGASAKGDTKGDRGGKGCGGKGRGGRGRAPISKGAASIIDSLAAGAARGSGGKASGGKASGGRGGRSKK
jgi:hypothetical protein